jgi:hypothetical protein
LKTPDVAGECAQDVAPGSQSGIARNLFRIIEDESAAKRIGVSQNRGGYYQE